MLSKTFFGMSLLICLLPSLAWSVPVTSSGPTSSSFGGDSQFFACCKGNSCFGGSTHFSLEQSIEDLLEVDLSGDSAICFYMPDNILVNLGEATNYLAEYYDGGIGSEFHLFV